MSPAASDLGGCIQQAYWYDDGVQRGRFCDHAATRVVLAFDGSRNRLCTEHADAAVAAGAVDVTGRAR